jgi:hypothetical protein
MPDPAGVAGGARQPRIEQPLSTSAPGADLHRANATSSSTGARYCHNNRPGPIISPFTTSTRLRTTAEHQRPDQI